LGEFLALTALVLFSSNTLLTKIGTGRVDINVGFVAAVGVNILVAIALLIGQILVREQPFTWNWWGFLYFSLAGGFSTFLGRWFYFEAVFRFGPARASIYHLANPLFTVLIAALFLGERLNAATLAGIFVTLAGLFMAVYEPGALSTRPSGVTADYAASWARRRAGVRDWMRTSIVFLGMFSALAYSVGNVWRGAAMQAWNEPIAGGLFGALAGLLMFLLFAPHSLRVFAQFRTADRVGLLIFAGTGTLNITAQILTITALNYLPVSVVSLIVSCVPVLVIPLSVLLFRNREGMTWRTAAGVLLTVYGIYLILFNRGV